MPLPPLNDDAGRWRRAFRLAKAVPISLGLFSSLIAINFLQTASLLIRPFSSATFRKINRWFADTWWGWCVVVADRTNGIRYVLSGDEVPAEENAIVVCNHQQMPDITTVMAFARAKKRLGDLKFFVKKALKWVPGMGWGMQFLDCLFVHRDWSADRESIRRTFAKIVDHKIPLWLVSFVEGTRATEAKVAQSQEFARSRGLPVTRHVLLPRTKGFTASVEGLRSHVDAVYDLTIGYVDGVPSLWQYIKGMARQIHLHVRRFPINGLPTAEVDVSSWLVDRFYEKDLLLEHYYRHGMFPEEAFPAELKASR